MPSETSDRRVAKTQQMGNPLPPPPAEQEPLPCPRCDSTNTKFCYYNNYNFSQPRHFCKSCRRYWTHGGTLRDIPVGGGSRKNAKRSRTTIPTHTTSFSSSNSSAATTASNATTCCPLDSIPATPLFVSLSGSAGGGPYGGDVSILKPGNVTVSCVPSTGSFTSLLNASGPAAGFLALGGFGLGIGPGIEDIGLGRGIWPFPEVGYLSSGGGISGTGGGGGVAASAVGGNANGNTWQVDAGAENGFVGGGDCFSSWPELAISTPGNGLK